MHAPAYVDLEKPPGMTDVPKTTVISWLRNAPFVLIQNPNVVWAAISLLMYAIPYKTVPVAPITYDFFAERFPLWFTLTFGYTAFWHILLYGSDLAKRPFISDRIYRPGKVIHNIFWSTSGIAIWTVFENIFRYLWTSGRLPYIDDVQSFQTVGGFARFMAMFMAVPVWRSVHFYFAHRFLHYGPMYNQVHSLHHRNTDPEPFSGLTMHPVEHLYYYSCVLPSLIFTCSPHGLIWNGVHLLLSPGASHSGYEDHFGSDLYHYLHHRYLECNYSGADASFLDIWFGSYVGSFRGPDRLGPKPREDAKSSLHFTYEFMVYLMFAAACGLPWIMMEHPGVSGAALVGFGPVAVATLMSPVHIDKSWATALHIGMGVLFCNLPVTYMCWLAKS